MAQQPLHPPSRTSARPTRGTAEGCGALLPVRARSRVADRPLCCALSDSTDDLYVDLMSHARRGWVREPPPAPHTN